jgi:hypothetical protein
MPPLTSKLLEIEIEQLGEYYSPSRTRKFGKKETNITFSFMPPHRKENIFKEN